MTAGLVVLIWALADPALSNVFNEAINRVLNFDEIHHEVHFNNGSSVKDSVKRIEEHLGIEPPK